MLKKSLLLILLLTALFAPWAAIAQETLTVYDDESATSRYIPIDGYYVDGTSIKTEYIMPSTALTAMNGKEITQMTFYLQTVGNRSWGDAVFRVFMKEVDTTVISSFSGYNDATVVYVGGLDCQNTEMNVVFDNSYLYGGGNLLIGFYVDTKGTYTGTYNDYKPIYYGKTVSGASIYYYTSTIQQNFLPKTKFTYQNPPTCPKPTNLHANLTEGNGTIATLVWTEKGSASNWEVIYGTDPTLETHLAPVTTGFNVDGSTISCNLTGLTAETAHYAKVKAVCEAGVDESEYTDIIEFTPSNTLTLTINDPTTTTSYYIPFYYSVGTYGAIKSQFITLSTNLTGMQWGEIKKLTFYNSSGNVNFGTAKFNVYLATTTNTTLSSFVDWSSMTKVVSNGSVTISGNKMEIVLDTPFTYTGDNLIIGFSQSSTGTNGTYNDTWVGKIGTSGQSRYYYSSESSSNFLPKVTFNYLEGEEPDCMPVSNLSYSNEQATSVNLNWNAGGSGETAWKLQYKKTTEEEWTTYPSAITEKPFTLPNLNELTTYQWQVAAWCDTSDPDGISDYVAGTNFTTKQTPVVVGDSWSDNFEGESCGWQFVNGSQTNKWFWGTAVNNGGTHAIYISNSTDGSTHNYNNGTSSYVYATKLLHFADSKYTFEYNWRANGESTWDYLRVWLAPSTFEFTPGQLPNGNSSGNNNYTSTTPTGWIPLDNTVTTGGKLNLQNTWQSKSIAQNVTEGNWYLVFMWCNDGGSGEQQPAAFDNISITRVACGYDVAGLEVATEPAPTAHTATINWTAGDPGQWQVAWSKDNTFAPANTQTETVSTNTINLVNLDAASTYYVKVRAYCGGEDYGAWCNAIDFPTECEAISDFPWSYNFNSDATGNFSKLCWVNDIVSGSYKFKVSNSMNGSNSTNQLYMYYYSGSVAKLVLPELAIPTGKTYQFVIDVYRTTYSTSYNDGIRVYANTSRDLEGATELGFLYRVCTKTDNGVVTAETTTGWYTYAFDIPYDGSCFVILKGEGQGGNSTYVDNFVIRQAPDCDTPTGLAVTANSQTPEGATITWTAGEGTAWTVEYKKTADENWTTITPNVTAPTYTFTGLDASTSYKTRVSVVCSAGDGVTYPTDPVGFTTDVACPAPKNLVVSNVTSSSATLTWAPGYTETEWTVKYKKHADAEYTTVTPNVTVNPTVSLPGLTGATAYDVQIIGCEPTHIYSVNNAFSTAYGVPFTEAFATDSQPASWNQYSGLMENVLAGTENLVAANLVWVFTNTNVFGAYHTKLNIFGITKNHWLVTPNIEIGNDNYNLNFDIALTKFNTANAAGTDCDDDKFAALITTDNGATWSQLALWDNAGSARVYNDIKTNGEEVNLDLSSYKNQIVRIAFYGESTVAADNGDNDLHIDNVSIDLTPACYRPFGLTASDVTNHSATLTWTAGSNEQTAWEFKYNKGADFNPAEAGTLVEDITTNPYTFDKTLDAASTYYFYVRGNCGGEPSAWSKKVCSFTTEAAAPAPTTFAKTEVGPDYVDLYWNAPTGDYLSGYGIYHSTSSTEPTEETDATVTIDNPTAPTSEAPYRLPNLENETTYYLWIRANHGTDVYSAWTAITGSYITTLEACPAPTVNEAANLTQNTAEISWTGSSDDYTVKYASVTTKYFEGFEESTSLDSWSKLDKDGGATTKIARSSSAGYNSDYGVRFSWTSYPPLYLISPDLSSYITTSGLKLEFYYKNNQAGNTNYPETFCIGFSSTDKEIASFDFGGEITADDLQWHHYSNSIPAGTKYIAVKYTSDDQFYLDIDDFSIIQISDWTTAASAVQSPYTITGLTKDTKYNVKVVGNCGGTPSLDSNIINFTTLPEHNIVFPEDGNWTAGNFEPNGSPTTEDDVIIRADVTITGSTNAAANNINIENGFVITVAPGATLTIAGEVTGGTAASIIIEEGGQVIHANAVNATLLKEIEAYSTKSGDGWYLIASPVDGLSTDAVATGTYDLFKYDEPSGWWYSNTGTNAPFTSLTRSQGYLYANAADIDLNFAGSMIGTNDEVTKTLSFACTAYPDLKGYNLMGNPFTRNLGAGDITLGGEPVTSVLLLNNDEDYQTCNFLASGVIKPGQGFFIQADDENQELVFNPSSKNESEIGLISIKAGNDEFMDKAYIQIGGGNTLRKIAFSDNNMVYVMDGDDDYAAMTIYELANPIPVHFVAAEPGTYTITVNAKNIDLDYMHLVDEFTNEHIDLLSEPTYTFTSAEGDKPGRFTIVFGIDNVEENLVNNVFAYQYEDELVVDGNGTLQIFDVLGRFVSSYEVNGSARINISSLNTGVYVLRMVGENVKTQKIVVK